jgi:hypothetical protein
MEQEGILQPIICTHAGFAGLAYGDIPDYIKYSPAGKGPSEQILWGKPIMFEYVGNRIAFNPSSINLYDEDILQVLQSGGLIGISLDKRILGYAESDEFAGVVQELMQES